MTQQSVVTQDQIARIAELYIGYFNRAPEASGLNYWGQEFARLQANGLTEDEALQQISSNFYDAGVKYGLYSVTMTPEDFVLTAYKNVLGRDLSTEPAANREEALKAWVPVLESGDVSREQFIATLIDTAKGYANDPEWGWVADYLQIRDALALEFAKPQYSGGLSEAEAIRKGMDALKFTSPEAVKNGQTVEQAIALFDKVKGDFSLVTAEEPEQPTPDPMAGDNHISVDAPLSQPLDGGEGFDTLTINVKSAFDAAGLVPNGVTVQGFEVINVDESAAKLSGVLDASVFGSAAQQVWQVGHATDISNVGGSQAAGFRNITGNAETVKVGFTGATGTVALDKASAVEFIIIDQKTTPDVPLTKVAFMGATGGYLNLGSSVDAIGDLGGQIGLPSDPTLSSKLNGVLTNVVTKVEDTLGKVGSNMQNSNSLVGHVLGSVIVGVNGVLEHVTDLLSGLGASGGLLNQLTGGRIGTGPVASVIGNAVHGLQTVASNLTHMATSLVAGITGTVGNISSSMQNSNSVLLQIVGNITGTVNGLVSHLNSMIGDLTNGTTSASDVLGNLKQGIETGVKGLLDHVSTLTQNVADHFQDSTGVLGQLVSGVASTASGLLARLDSILSSDSGTVPAPVEHHPALPDSVTELDLALTDATDIRVYDGATLSHVKVLDASASTGDIKLHLETVPSASLQTLKLGSGNDQVTMSTATLDASALKVDLGDGDDRIVTLLDNVSDKAATPISLALTGGKGSDTFAFIGGNISAADVSAKSFSNVVTITDFGNGNDTLALSYFTGFTSQKLVDNAITKLGANATLFDAVKAVSALTKEGNMLNHNNASTTETVHFVFKGDTYVYQDFDHNGLDSGDLLIKLAGVVPVEGHVSSI